MTAIRNFPNAPMRQGRSAGLAWRTPAFVLAVWRALERSGQRRAAWELEALAGRRALGNPQLARQLYAAAAECRRAAAIAPAHTDRSVK
jgi:hypothetical protein